MIDLTEIMTNFKESIDLDNEYDLSSTITSGDILDLSKITLRGKIEKEEDGIYIKANVEGKMKIRDSVTLDEVWYPFSFEIDENLDETLKNGENSLDIIELLWQNIVLEVPLRYTTVENTDEYKGEGWKLVSEEELHKDNPFSALLDEKDRSD